MPTLRRLGPVLLAASALACGSAEHDSHDAEAKFGPAPRTPAPTAAAEADGSDSAEAPPPTAGDEGGQADADPGVQPDGSIVSAVAWFEGSLEQALAKAKAEDKLVFVDIGAYWCPPCHKLDEQTFTDARVGAWLAERAVAVHIDAEKGEGPELAASYRVQAYPTLLLLEANGLEKGRLVDFVAPAELVTRLEALAAGGNVLAELEAEVAAAPDELEPRYRLAHAYLLAARRDQADTLFDALLAADPDNTAGFASKVLYERATFFTMKLDGDDERAIAELRELQTRFPDSPEASLAYRMSGRALCRLERPDEAVAALEAMVAKEPDNAALKARFGWFAFRQRCRPDAGLKAVLAGIEQAPKDAELRYLEAELRRLLEQPAEALAAIKQASAIEPQSAYYKRQVRRFEELASAAGSEAGVPDGPAPTEAPTPAGPPTEAQPPTEAPAPTPTQAG